MRSCAWRFRSRLARRPAITARITMTAAATATPIQATLAARYTSAPYNSSHARSVLGRAVPLNPQCAA